MKSYFNNNDLFKNKNIINAKVNEILGLLVYTLNQYNESIHEYVNQIVLLDLNSNEITFISDEMTVMDYIWVEEGLLIHELKNTKSSLVMLNIDSKVIKPLFSIDLAIENILIKNKKIFFIGKQRQDKSDIYLESSTILPFFSEPSGVLDYSKQRLYSYDLELNKVDVLTDEDLHIKKISSRSDTNLIVFIAFNACDILNVEASIYTYDMKNCNVKLLSQKNRYKLNDLIFYDLNTIIFLGTECLKFGRNENFDIYSIDLLTSEIKKLTNDTIASLESCNYISESTHTYNNILFTKGKYVYFRTIDEYCTYLSKININGDLEKVHYRKGTIDTFDFYHEQLIFAGMNHDSFHELYVMKDGLENKISDYNSWVINKHILMPEHHIYKTDENVEISGWVIKPYNREFIKNYPGILKIHGGPKMTYNDTLSIENQILAQNGYYIFYCNPRGSDGKGNTFADIRGEFASKAYNDIMKFTNDVIKDNDNLDTNRMGVLGGSYGGYMVNYMIAKTDIFSAAISERGISNLVSAFNTSDMGYQYFGDYVGKSQSPWQMKDLYIENSPIFFCEKVTTPTMFMHGKDDKRCNYTESLQMYSALKYIGVDTKLHLFIGENHSLSVAGKPKNRMIRLKEIQNWFLKYLGKGDNDNDDGYNRAVKKVSTD